MVVRKQILRVRFITVLSLLLTLGMTVPVNAAQSTSTNYSVNEVFFGTGGNLNACSSSYCSKQAAGETTVGNTKSATYQAQGGFNTDRYPSLTFIVNTTNINLGIQAAGTTSAGVSTFSVKSYLSSGYAVQTFGAGLVAGGHTITNLASPTASNPAAEQFGINLVANTTPASLSGTSQNPVQVPGSTYGFGAAATGYNTSNLYNYNAGDVIAQSTQSSGETDYTISYILNTTAITSAGSYSMSQVLVATSTF